MNDADRAECGAVWEEAFEVFDMSGSSAAITCLVAAKRKWEIAAANAKLEEIASMLENPSWLGHWMAEEIRALKQE